MPWEENNPNLVVGEMGELDADSFAETKSLLATTTLHTSSRKSSIR